MENIQFKFNLGQKVRDTVTGFSGIIVRSAICLNGCIQYVVQPPINKSETNKFPDTVWIDEAQIEVIDQGISVEKKSTGGPSTKGPSSKFK